MKHTKYLLALLAVTAGISACKKPEIPTEIPVIQLAETSVSIQAEGGDARIAYTIEHAVDGKELKATSQDEWITDISVKTRVIEFTAGKNESGALRTGKIVLSYEGAENKEITVTQDQYENPITLTVHAVDATSVTFSVNTSTEDITWIAQIVGKEWYDSYENDQAIFEADLAYFSSEASYFGVTLKEYISGIMNKGTRENLRYPGLDPLSDYILYAYGITADGERTTSLYQVPIKTTEPYEGPITFEFDIKDTDAVMEVTCTPSHDGVAYYWDMTTPEALSEFGGTEDIKASLSKWLESKISEWLSYGDYADRAEIYEYYSTKNSSTSIYEGIVNTDYIFFAFKWDGDCHIVGDVASVEHSTGDITPSSNDIQVTVSNITQSSLYVETTTTNSDPYFLIVEPVSEMSEVNLENDDEVFQYFYDWLGTFLIWSYINNGNIGGTFYELTPDTEYYVVSFGYLSGARTTPVKIEKVRTLASGAPNECMFDIEISNIRNTSAEVSIKPSDKGHWYYWDVFPANTSATMVTQAIQKKFNEEYYGDMWEFSSELTIADDYGYLNYLSPDTEYKIAAVIIDRDSETLDFLSYVRFSDTFSTPEIKISSTTVTCGFPEYYDGDEIAELEPNKFGGMAGKPYLPLEIEIDGDYSSYYYTLFEYIDGLDDPAQYPDTELYETLMEVGWSSSLTMTFTGEWNKPLMLAAMAIDLEGNYSAIYRSEPFTLTKNGAAPATNFINNWGKTSSAGALKSVKAGAGVSKGLKTRMAATPEPQTRSAARFKRIAE